MLDTSLEELVVYTAEWAHNLPDEELDLVLNTYLVFAFEMERDGTDETDEQRTVRVIIGRELLRRESEREYAKLVPSL